VNILFHEILRVPLAVPPGAVRFEIVLPWPPLHLAICARDANESFQRSFGRSLLVPSRFVVTIAIVLRRETNTLFHAFSMTALERFGVLPLVFPTGSQHRHFDCKQVQKLTLGLSDSWAENHDKFHIRAAAGWTVFSSH
jgi:hypothetical protein